MFKFIKVAALGVALTMGVANVSHAKPHAEACKATTAVIEVVGDLRDRGHDRIQIFKVMVTNGVPADLARNIIKIVYNQPRRSGTDIALDFYIDCMSEPA